jgi:hypothetical protein
MSCPYHKEKFTAKSKTGKGEDGQGRGSKKGKKNKENYKKVPGTFLRFTQ